MHCYEELNLLDKCGTDILLEAPTQIRLSHGTDSPITRCVVRILVAETRLIRVDIEGNMLLGMEHDPIETVLDGDFPNFSPREGVGYV